MTGPSQFALALDIGGSHITAAVVDRAARRTLSASLHRQEVQPSAPAGILIDAWASAALAASALAAIDQAGVQEVRHVGIAMPGPFDYAQGISHLTHKFAALYGWNVREALRQHWVGTALALAPVYFANDAAAWALGEWWAGAAFGVDRAVGVTLGTGLGSGFIDQGMIIDRGENVPPGGQIWNSPYRDGIAEDYVSGRALGRAYQALTGLACPPVEIAAAAGAGDQHAQAVFSDFGCHLAEILAPWMQRFNADCLVLGGNIAHAWPLFSKPLVAGLPWLTCRVTQQYEISSLLGGAALDQ